MVIVAYQAGGYLRRCVDALKAQNGVRWEAVIVDNASTDGSLEGLALDARFRVVASPVNLGFAEANNVGARGSKARWIACLNPDAFPRAGWLAKLVAGAEAAGAEMAGSTQVFADAPDTLDGLGDAYHISGLAWRAGFGHPVSEVPRAPYPVFGPCAAAALYDRELFERVGGFDARFFCYHEDVDLALRMRRAGGAAVQVPGAVVDHVSSGIAGRASDFAVFHGTRNRMWTFAKSMPLAGLVLFGPLHVGMMIAMGVWAMFRSDRGPPTWRGTWAGVRGLPRMLRARREVPRDVGLRGLWPVMAVDPRGVVRRGLVPAVRTRND